ncbi:amidohydrolase [Desulfovibrio sp. OttesenSCG-928-I05]|nr:amidohydrolase [Desulfovibrio sp. OttesenSCG-928-I05]
MTTQCTTAARPCERLVSADRIVTQDPECPIIEKGAIALDKGRILALGTRAAMESAYAPAARLDLGEALLMPGLVNAHTHASMTLLRGLADDLPLMTWLNEHIFPVEQRLTRELTKTGALLACAEMMRLGVTAFTDMYLLEDGVFEAADEAGLRMLGGEVVFAFPSPAYTGTPATLDCIRRQAGQWQGHSRIRVAVMPHAVYTTTPELLTACRDFAEKEDLPLHMHLAETPAETTACLEAQGKRPVPYCRDLGLLSPRMNLAHCVDLTEEEMDILAESGVIVSHCPRSNMKLASGVSPVPAMLERGIPVAIGTDGAASNNALNVFADMSAAALLHKVHTLSPTALPATAALDLATLGGAKAMHMPDAGALKAGNVADIIALDISGPSFTPLHNPASSLVYATSGQEVRMTMVEGEILYLDGEYSRFNLADLRARMAEAVAELTSA